MRPQDKRYRVEWPEKTGTGIYVKCVFFDTTEEAGYYINNSLHIGPGKRKIVDQHDEILNDVTETIKVPDDFERSGITDTDRLNFCDIGWFLRGLSYSDAELPIKEHHLRSMERIGNFLRDKLKGK